MQKPRYTFGYEGPSYFLRLALGIQATVVEPFFDGHDWQYDHEYFTRVPALYQSRQPTALGGLEVAGIVICFIGTCFAKKIFDEIYERTLKRPIGAQLDRLFTNVEIPLGKMIEFRDIIYLEDINLVIVIRAIAAKDSGDFLQKQVMEAHRIAHGYIEQYGRKAPIHCYKIIQGKISIEPEFFHTLEQIKQYDRAEVKSMHQLNPFHRFS